MITYGKSVYLSYFDLVYSDTLFRWRNDIRIRRYCRQNDLLNWNQHSEWMKRVGANPTEKMYFITRRSDHSTVGVAGLTSIDTTNQRAEFSLYIGPEFHKKGYGKDALQTLVSHGFNSLNLHSIWGETFSFNPASKMFEKLGFKKEGVRRDFYYREGQFIDAILYAVRKSEWPMEKEQCSL